MSDKIIEELTEENMSDPNWSGGKSREQVTASPAPAEEERILSLTVDIPQGTQEVLEIRASDDIEGITEQFCAKHDLDADCKQMLIDNIRTHLFGNANSQTEQQIQEEQQEEEVQQEVQQEEERPEPEIQPEQSQNEEPKQLEELAGELEDWKKEAEQKIREKIAMHNYPSIDQNSKRIAEEKGLSTIPVYERLHKKALVKQKAQRKAISKEKAMNIKVDLGKQKKSKATAASQRAKPEEKPTAKNEKNNIFHHHLLYQKGRKQMQDREKMTEQGAATKTEKDLAASSFKPRINANSRLMVLIIAND